MTAVVTRVGGSIEVEITSNAYGLLSQANVSYTLELHTSNDERVNASSSGSIAPDGYPVELEAGITRQLMTAVDYQIRAFARISGVPRFAYWDASTDSWGTRSVWNEIPDEGALPDASAPELTVEGLPANNRIRAGSSAIQLIVNVTGGVYDNLAYSYRLQGPGTITQSGLYTPPDSVSVRTGVTITITVTATGNGSNARDGTSSRARLRPVLSVLLAAGTQPNPSSAPNVGARRRKSMTLQNFDRDVMFVPNHDATELAAVAAVGNVGDDDWRSVSDGMVHPGVAHFTSNGSFTLAAGKQIAFGAHMMLPDIGEETYAIYRIRFGAFSLGNLRLAPFVGEPTAAVAASNLVKARALGLSSELLGYDEVIGMRPSEGRSFFAGICILNSTNASVTAVCKLSGSVQNCAVAAPRMAISVR